MSKGLLVDYGGVLTTSVLESFAGFCADEGIEVDAFRSVVLGAAKEPDSPFSRVEVGAITPEQFDVEVAALLSDGVGRTIAPDGLKARMFARSLPDTEMMAAVGSARSQGIRTVLVSNSWGGADYPLDVLEPLFDELVISGHVGLRKPDAEIYLLAAERAGVAPGSCVFLDDFRINIEGAKAVGMEGVLHRSAAATIPAVEAFLGVTLR